MRKFGCVLILLLFGTVMARGGAITPDGKKLAKVLDEMNVEKLWLPKHYVNWKTGEALDKPVTDGKVHTHCSAFVAAACMKFDIYILRPPEHSASFLANAQFDWLHEKGKDKGWSAVATAKEAQRLANKGLVVVAVFKEKDPKKHGHIAIVRPSTRNEKSIAQDGPQIIQAGMINANSTTLKEGFRYHPTAWRDAQVRFFVHESKAAKEKQ